MVNQIVVSLFALPHEIDQLGHMLRQLHKDYILVDKDIDWVIDISLSISDTLINWEESEIPQEYFVEKLEVLKNTFEFGSKFIRATKEINGAFDQRRFVAEHYPNADYHIWLDPDIIMGEGSLKIVQESVKAIYGKYPLSILTPETVKYFDYTWDVLVNENFQNEKYRYQANNDSIKDSGIKGEITLESINANIPNQPRYKFGGGLLTTLSRELLELMPLPKENIKPYGWEDTFLMWAMEIYKRQGKDIHQLKIKNLVVCENRRHLDTSYYTNRLEMYDLRKPYFNHNVEVLGKKLQTLANNTPLT